MYTSFDCMLICLQMDKYNFGEEHCDLWPIQLFYTYTFKAYSNCSHTKIKVRATRPQNEPHPCWGYLKYAQQVSSF